MGLLDSIGDALSQVKYGPDYKARGAFLARLGALQQAKEESAVEEAKAKTEGLRSSAALAPALGLLKMKAGVIPSQEGEPGAIQIGTTGTWVRPASQEEQVAQAGAMSKAKADGALNAKLAQIQASGASALEKEAAKRAAMAEHDATTGGTARDVAHIRGQALANSPYLIHGADEQGNPMNTITTRGDAVNAARSGGALGGVQVAGPQRGFVQRRTLNAKASIGAEESIRAQLQDPAVQEALGPLSGRVTKIEDFLGAPDPRLKGLQETLNSVISAQPGGTHAFNGLTRFELTPESIIAGVHGLNEMNRQWTGMMVPKAPSAAPHAGGGGSAPDPIQALIDAGGQ